MFMNVLIGVPTYEGQAYCLQRFLACIRNLNPPAHVLFVDNSPTLKYSKVLESAGFAVIHNKTLAQDKISKIIENRNIIIKHAVQKGYDSVLFLDSDVLPPINIVSLLSQHQKPIVSGVYLGVDEVEGKPMLVPMAYDWAADNQNLCFLPLELVIPQYLLKIAACGFGCVLIKTQLLKNIPLRQDPEHEGGEDILFCRDAHNAGIPVYLDTRVKCVHMRPKRDFVIPLSRGKA